MRSLIGETDGEKDSIREKKDEVLAEKEEATSSSDRPISSSSIHSLPFSQVLTKESSSTIISPPPFTTYPSVQELFTGSGVSTDKSSVISREAKEDTVLDRTSSLPSPPTFLSQTSSSPSEQEMKTEQAFR